MITETNTWLFLGLNLDGLVAGVATWVVIWATRYACIKGEYYLKRNFRLVFLVFGLAGVILALLINNLVFSAISAIFGFASLWGIHEVIEQEERVKKGWYPQKPDKQ